MLAPAVCLGMSLPLAARLANPKDGEVGAGVGAVLAANTAGNVLGAFFGYWALPWLGLQGLFRSGTTVELVLGAALLWRASGGWDRRGWAAAAACAAVLVGWRAAMPRWDLRLMQQGFFRSRIVRPPHDFDEFRSHFKEITMPFYRDDREATVSVTTYPDVEAVLKVDGKTDASTGGDMRTQILLGELPLLLKPGARRAMLVGWGSGVTAGSILRHPVEALDAAELIPAVVDASEWFRAENGGALADRRLDLRVEDARTSLRRDGPAYDVIVSEPSNPWMAGVGNLFTREFYLQARRRLAPGGMMVQWFHLYEMNDEVFRAALRTYLSVFPHVTLWNVVDTDVLLVGSAEPLAPDFSAMERRFLSPAVWDDLRRAEFSTLTTLLALQSASEETVRAMAGEGPLNTDARPILEYEAPKAFFRADHVKAVIDADDRADPVPAQRLLLAKYLKARGRGLEPREYMDRVMFPHAFFEAKILRALIADWSRRYPKDPKAAVALYWLESVGKNKEAAERALRRTAALAREPRSAAAKSVIIGRP
jgi:spermidine synthase